MDRNYASRRHCETERRDRAAPDEASDARRQYVAPIDEMETALGAIWAELLGLERVGRHDHFFDLGGRSLLAVRLINLLRQVYGVELALVSVFAAPTLAEFALAVTESSRSTFQTFLPQIPKVARNGQLDLSFAQERLWFLVQLEGTSSTYNMPLALRLFGPLNVEAWRRSLNHLFARHDALRSVFVASDGLPYVELLAANIGIPLVDHDLRDEPNAKAYLDHLCWEEAHAPFDLATGPLIRARLIRMGEQNHVFLLTQHHIVSDGWSMGIVARELSALYKALVDDQNDRLPPLAVQYPDYAAWQRQWLSGERLLSQVAYWRQTLTGAPVRLDLPTDRPRPLLPSFDGASVPVWVDAELTQNLKRLGQRHGTTLFITLLTAWAAVLSRLTGQDDLIIGVPTANRGRSEIEEVIGLFVNTLALRIDLSSQPSFAELLSRTRRISLAAQENQDLPFEQVVEIVNPPRYFNQTPLFQVMFAWNNNEDDILELHGLSVHMVRSAFDQVKFDLELNLSEADGCIVGDFSYATALFDIASVERHRDYLLAVLRAMVADAEQIVARIDILPTAERELLLKVWNRTEASYPVERCIHQLFEEQVRRAPNATALVFEDQSLSYGELNARANRMAHYLIGLRVGPDAIVALCVDRGIALVIGLLAVLKAGGAYLPLDPNYPAERLIQILNEAKPQLLILDDEGRRVLKNTPRNSQVIDIDAASSNWADQPSTDPDAYARGLTSQNLAYVIYTSGSTGTPKGVMVEHRSLVNCLNWMQDAYEFGQTEVVLQKTSFAFDVSAWEFFLTLSSGAKLVLVASQSHRDLDFLVELINRQNVTSVHFVPSMLSGFLCANGIENCESLRRLICIGEALTFSSIQACRKSLPAADLYNLYGPTETTINSTAWMCSSKFKGPQVPIGRPISNTRIYILDGYGLPVPLGVVGEIYIGGVGVARGYLNRPDLTAERFLADPFSLDSNARMYRSGDLARYLPDGNIEFLGRNDQQVKIRGFRIELGEIETCLGGHPAVKQAVVLAREDGAGDKRLVAYVVLAEDCRGLERDQNTTIGTSKLATALREHLVARLPDYMVPSAFVRLDALPLTVNGKLDQKALSSPVFTAIAALPETHAQQRLALLFARTLGLDRVGVDDNFFDDLGGNSISAMRIISAIRREFSSDVDLSAMFTKPTVRTLSAVIETASARNDRSIRDAQIPTAINVNIDTFEWKRRINRDDIKVLLHERFYDQPEYTRVFVATVDMAESDLILYAPRGSVSSSDVTTAFPLGSISKMLTSILLCRMEQAGKLSLHDRLGDCLPIDWALPHTLARHISLVDLATHTSGLTPYVAELENADQYALRTYLEAFRPEPAERKYRYSSFGISLLGQALCQRGQGTFLDLLDNYLLSPLGLTGTIPIPRIIPAFIANNSEVDFYACSQHMASSIVDLQKILRSFLSSGNGSLGSTLARMLSVSRPTGMPKLDMTVGLRSRRSHEAHLLYHGGGGPNYSAFFGFAPELNRGIVALANREIHIADICQHWLWPAYPIAEASAARLKITKATKSL